MAIGEYPAPVVGVALVQGKQKKRGLRQARRLCRGEPGQAVGQVARETGDPARCAVEVTEIRAVQRFYVDEFAGFWSTIVHRAPFGRAFLQ